MCEKNITFVPKIRVHLEAPMLHTRPNDTMQPTRQQLFSRDESFALKALCIIVVMTHNYLHMRGWAAENEFQFFADRVENMRTLMLHPDWRTLLHFMTFAVSSFLCGFMFCTGYGLVKKYEQPGAAPFNRLSFIGSHYLKLVSLQTIPMLVAFVDYIALRGHQPLTIKDGALQLLLLGNLQWDQSIYPYVYWYLGMAMQLYIVYALLLHHPHGHYGPWHQVLQAVLVAGCGVWQMCCEPTGEWMHYLHSNFVPYLGAMAAGMVAARHLDNVNLNHMQWGAVALVSGALMLYCLQYFYTWIWMWIPSVIFLVSLVKALALSRCRPVVWLGSVSALVYVIHPIVREVSLHYKHSGHDVADLIIYMVASIAIAAGYAWLRQLMRRGGKWYRWG